LGIGDWGLGMGIGDWAQSPIPNPQSPIPNPQSPMGKNYISSIIIILFEIIIILELNESANIIITIIS
jgi:hypothetical protein